MSGETFEQRRPRLLLFSYNFPPAAEVGALRPWSLAKYLPHSGWDVEVVAGEHLAIPRLPERVRCVRVAAKDPWSGPRRVLGWLRARSGAPRSRDDGVYPSTSRWRPLTDRVYRYAYYPDHGVTFLPGAIRAAVTIHRECPVDMIFATGPYWSGLLAGWAAARRLGLPLVVEFRDTWAGSIYGRQGGVLEWLDRRVEARVVSASRMVVAVTSTAGDLLRERYPNARITVAPVGFDPDLLLSSSARTVRNGPLTLVHCGSLYDLRRDPTPLLEALARMKAAGSLTRGDLEVRFLGVGAHQALRPARDFGVEDWVRVQAHVPRPAALQAQRDADVLLAIVCDDPHETTAIPTKLYEYLAMRKPILGLGPKGNPTAGLLDRIPGSLYSTDARLISRHLEGWLARYRCGRPLGWGTVDLADLSWDVVVSRLGQVLRDVLAQPPSDGILDVRAPE